MDTDIDSLMARLLFEGDSLSDEEFILLVEFLANDFEASHAFCDIQGCKMKCIEEGKYRKE